MMKTIYQILYISFCASLLFSCEKEDKSANKLHGGDGVWLIENIQYIGYDSTGNTLYDSSIIDPGELIFFSTSSLNALYGYYQGVYFDYEQNAGSVLEYMVDGKRAHIQKIEPIDQLGLARIWTVSKEGKRKQEWICVSLKNAPFTLNEKIVLSIKSKNAF